MTTWYTSDLHFSHVNIITFCQRPFTSVKEMNETIISNWNSVVTNEDTVFALGDILLGKIDDSLLLVRELNGTKLLVPGNHDRCHPMNKQHEKWRDRYLAEGFADVLPGIITADVDGYDVQVSHFPFEGDSHDVDRFADWRPVDSGGWVIHGHVHNRWRQNGKQINIGIDAWAGYPVDGLILGVMLSNGPAYLDPLPWTRD